MPYTMAPTLIDREATATRLAEMYPKEAVTPERVTVMVQLGLSAHGVVEKVCLVGDVGPTGVRRGRARLRTHVEASTCHGPQSARSGVDELSRHVSTAFGRASPSLPIDVPSGA